MQRVHPIQWILEGQNDELVPEQVMALHDHIIDIDEEAFIDYCQVNNLSGKTGTAFEDLGLSALYQEASQMCDTVIDPTAIYDF